MIKKNIELRAVIEQDIQINRGDDEETSNGNIHYEGYMIKLGNELRRETSVELSLVNEGVLDTNPNPNLNPNQEWINIKIIF